ncbi:hypothetical protein [Kribbella italica]|uniref:Uncharacterized protein n=1 Tax=Kribbella italica TaxID=1540520 RepID=A0A7W9MSY6_9ACTN|nr:hypothetical protein [Kribbella italica]MBB5834662.1 hypothetical protein [Kribbella italica]
MPTNEGMLLLIAILIAVFTIRYWRRLFTAFLIAFTTVFIFGILQIAAIFGI